MDPLRSTGGLFFPPERIIYASLRRPWVWLGFCTLKSVLPFPKRPAAPAEEVFLPSEDLEALPSVSMVGMPFIPPPPAQPTFGPPSQSYGFSESNLMAPPPPHSLAPVAMGSDRSYGGVSATGTNPQQLAAPRDKPSSKWGIMIVLAGAVVGAVLGLGWDAGKRQAPTASISVPSVKAAANSVAAPTESPIASALAATTPAPVVAPVVAPPTDNAAPPGVIAPPTPPTKAEKRAASKAAAAAAAAERAEKAAADRADRAANAPKRSTLMATKVTAPPPAPKAAPPPPPPVVEKASPRPAPAKLTKTEKAAGEKAEKAEKKTGTPEARQTLEDAIKDTTNTL